MKKLIAIAFTLGLGVSAFSQVVISSIVETPTSCGGNCDGTITINASSAMPPLNYSIDGGLTFQGSNVFTGLCAGTYSVEVVDNMFIPETTNALVPDGSGATLSVLTLLDATCNGSTDGGIFLNVSGGVAPYTYTGTNGPNDSFLSNVGAGTYTISVTDGNGCTTIETYSISEPDAITIITMAENAVTCFGGSDGSVSVQAFGGDGNYSYLWSNTGVFSSISNIAAGTYTVTATDGNGCTGSRVYTVTEPAPIVVGITSITDVSCNGDANGAVSTAGSISGGDGTYTYSWSNGSTSQNLTNVAPGDYTLTVTDANGCIGVGPITTINEPVALSANIVVIDSVSCQGTSDGKLAVNVTGGTLPYSYSWTTGSVTDTAYNVYAADHDADITDGNGCWLMATIPVTEPSALVTTLSSTDVTCNGACDGTITGDVIGGTPPYTYLWDDPGTQATATAIGICENFVSGTNYILEVTDANGCIYMEETQIQGIVINEPTPLSLAITTVDATCSNSGGSVTVVVSGGTLPYVYSWSSGGNTDTETGLSDGSYTIDVVDGNACTASDVAVVGLTVIPIDVCVVTVDQTSTKNVIVWEKPIATGISHFNIYRDIVGTYTFVASVPYDSLSQFEDNTGGVNPQVTQYRYEISVVDSCGNESVLSDFHQTIHLNAPNLVGSTADLVWQEYAGLTTSYYYRILRDSTLTDDWQVIDSVSSTTLVFTDIDVPSSPNVRYLVQIAISNTCSATKAQDHNSTRSNRTTIVGPTSIKELSGELFEVSPNPNNGVFTIRFKNNISSDRKITITDLQGKVVLELYSQVGENQKEINLSEFENGLYLMKVKSEQHVQTIRIIKQ